MKFDFFTPAYRMTLKNKRPHYEIYPEFHIRPSKDLMVRGGKFYAVINKATGFWQMDEYFVGSIIDDQLKRYYENEFVTRVGIDNISEENVTIRKTESFTTNSWIAYKKYVDSLPDHYHQLDTKLCFSNTKVEQKDYISKCLPYPLEPGSYDSWDQLIGTLYAPSERQKIEWAIGSVVSGDSKDIQKFVVFYGHTGAGKGTILTIIQKLFQGYYFAKPMPVEDFECSLSAGGTDEAR